METSLILGLGLFVVAGVVLVIIGVVRPGRTSAIDDRLAEFGTVGGPQTLEDIELSLPFSERVISPLIARVSRFVTSRTPAKTLEATQLKLELAGRPNNWGPREFMGFRILAASLLGVLGIALFVLLRNVSIPRRLLLVVVAAMLGYFMPTLWLGQKIRSRKNSIIKSLPDALDLLTICVEAGLGFDAAMANVAEKWNDDLSQQVRAVQAAKHGNIFTDTSSAKSITSGLHEWALSEIGADRILYGTDSPLYFAPMQRARIDNAGIEYADKEKILCRNAEKLFGL